MTDVALGERKEELSLSPTLSPAREPLVRYLQVKVQVRAMSEPCQSQVYPSIRSVRQTKK